MSESEYNKPIIPLGLAIDTEEGRDELREIIESELKKTDRKQLVFFASRVALRAAWSLEKLTVNDDEKLDRFYAIYLRALTATVFASFSNTSQSRRIAIYASVYYAAADVAACASDNYAAAAAACAAYAASAAASYSANPASAASAAFYSAYPAARQIGNNPTFINQLNSDLLTINTDNTDKSLIKESLFLDSAGTNQAPKLKDLDSFWNTYLFTPALNGKLFNTENDKLFFQGFLEIPEEIHKQQSEKAMRRFLQEYIANKGVLETTKTARLILLGNGGAGKTSIVKKILGEKLPQQGKATPRIEVRDYHFKNHQNEEIELNIWDFGGQVIMHSTHSFFISSQSTYIIACNSRANEQPDSWLEMLQNRINNRVTVLVVYTHCDTAAEYNSSQKQCQEAPWRRDNSLKRKFKQHFNLEFHNVDLNPRDDDNCYGFDNLKEKIKDRAIKEAATKMDFAIHAVKEASQALGKEKQPFISHKALIKRLKNQLSDNSPLDIFKLANNYGYIFPESPLDKLDSVDDDFIWIAQKHWLTYGVYQLVNNDEAIANNGVLKQTIIEEALNRNKSLLINSEGEVLEGEAQEDQGEEALSYCDQGIEVLRRILLNYRWAMRLNRHHELLLPLATRLDEPAEFAKLAGDYKKLIEKDESKQASDKETEQPAPVLMQIELVNKPSDFFFKLATYLDAHLLEPQHLWRTGAILHFYGNKNVRALIEMPENILSLKIFANTVNSADDQQSFQQLLVINIKETIKSYDSTNISAHSSERIVLVDNEGRGKGKMIRSDVIASLTGDHITLETLKAQLMERGRTMSTITINGNVTGNVGDHNHFDNQGGITHINSLGNELIEQLKQLAGKLPKTEAKRLDASVIALEKAVKEPDEAKKAGYFKKGIELAKDIVAIDKVIDAAGDTLTKIMEGIDAIVKWF